MRGVAVGGECGTSMVELVVVLAAIGALASLSIPATAHSIDAGRARDASGFVAARLRLARQQAAFRTASVGLVFDQIGGRWQMRVCQDGNGTGLRRADIADGTDVCREGPHDLETMFPGVSIDVDPSLRGRLASRRGPSKRAGEPIGSPAL